MARDAIAEWRRALKKREAAYGRFVRTIPAPRVAPPSLVLGDGHVDVPASAIVVNPLDRSRMRAVVPLSLPSRDQRDLAAAIRVLQRHNRSLRARFDVTWVDAMTFVFGEAQRRGTSAAHLARALSMRLRAEPAT